MVAARHLLIGQAVMILVPMPHMLPLSKQLQGRARPHLMIAGQKHECAGCCSPTQDSSYKSPSAPTGSPAYSTMKVPFLMGWDALTPQPLFSVRKLCI